VTSNAATLTAPAFVPSAPTSLTAFADDSAAVLSWTAPSDNGGSAITNYLIQYSSNGGNTWTSFSRSASTSPSATVTGLSNGLVYVFKVAAVNLAGTGAYSSNSSPVAPSSTPGDPYFDTVRLLVRADENVTNFATGGTPTVTFTGPNYSTSDMKFGSASAQLSPVVQQVCSYGCWDQITGPSYLRVNDSSRTIPANYTVEFWIKPGSDWGSDNKTKYLYKRDVDDGMYGGSGLNFTYYNGNLNLTVNSSDSGSPDGGWNYWRCDIYGTAQANVGTLSSSTWHHMAAVREGAALRIYLNGNRVATATVNASTSGGNLEPPTPCVATGNLSMSQWGDVQEIMGARLGWGSYVYENLTGKYDDIRISNKARYSAASFNLPTSAYPKSQLALPVISISAQPSSTTASGGAASFSVSASVTESATLSYQWQKQESGAGSFT
ncbi:MAG: fibronectin type III domain-containing protein, partial [Methylophilaceae bacterium]